MVRKVQPMPRDYGVALSTPMLAFVLTLLLAPWSKGGHVPLFMGAVIASGLHGGKRSGLVATGLSTLLLFFYHGLLQSSHAPFPAYDFYPLLGLFLLLAV